MNGGDPVGGAAGSPVAAFLAPYDTRDGPVAVPDQLWFEDDVRWRETGGSFVPAAVRGWFANGGRQCVLLPMHWPGAADDPVADPVAEAHHAVLGVELDVLGVAS